MLIERRSPLTGRTNTMEIAVSTEQLLSWQSGELIQRAMPDLTPVEREFIMTGYTENDWAVMFPPDGEEE